MTELSSVGGLFPLFSQLSSTRSLRQCQASSERIQVRRRKGRVQSVGVLDEAVVAHLGSAPQVLDQVESAPEPGAAARASLVDVALMVGQRLGVRAAATDPVAPPFWPAPPAGAVDSSRSGRRRLRSPCRGGVHALG